MHRAVKDIKNLCYFNLILSNAGDPMKVDNLNTPNNSLTGLGNIRQPKTNSAMTETSLSSNVQLSGRALDAHSSGEVFDSAKVDQIKAAISEGRFQVNPHAVADSLIQTARDLVMAQSRTA